MSEISYNLKATASIFHQPLFESEVAKMQGNDFSLKLEKKLKVPFYPINDNN